MKTIVNELAEALREKMRRSAAEAATCVQSPNLTDDDAEHIQTVAQAALGV